MIVSHEHRFIFLKTRKTGGSSIRMMLARLLDEPDYILSSAHVSEDFALREQGIFPRNFMDPAVEPNWLDERDHDISSPQELLAFRKQHGFRKPGSIEHLAIRSHASCDQVRRFVGKKIFDSYFKFAFDRNPFDRMVSLYKWRLRDDPLRINKRPRDIGFDRFVEQRAALGRTCNSRIYCSNGNLSVDHLARFENFNDEIAYILDRVGIPFSADMVPWVKSGQRKDDYRDFYANPETVKRVRDMHETCIDLLGYEY